MSWTILRNMRRWTKEYYFREWNRGNRNKTQGRRRVCFEQLEDRTLLTVAPQFTGPFGLSVGSLVNITHAAGNQTEGTIAVDPTTPNRVFAASNPGTTAAISTNAGATFATFNGSP